VRIRAAVAKTTGVSNTTVASRLSTAVTPAPVTKTNASSRRGLPLEPRAMTTPMASKSPSRRQPSAISNSAARNPTVGPNSPSASPA